MQKYSQETRNVMNWYAVTVVVSYRNIKDMKSCPFILDENIYLVSSHSDDLASSKAMEKAQIDLEIWDCLVDEFGRKLKPKVEAIRSIELLNKNSINLDPIIPFKPQLYSAVNSSESDLLVEQQQGILVKLLNSNDLTNPTWHSELIASTTDQFRDFTLTKFNNDRWHAVHLLFSAEENTDKAQNQIIEYLIVVKYFSGFWKECEKIGNLIATSLRHVGGSVRFMGIRQILQIFESNSKSNLEDLTEVSTFRFQIEEYSEFESYTLKKNCTLRLLPENYTVFDLSQSSTR